MSVITTVSMSSSLFKVPIQIMMLSQSSSNQSLNSFQFMKQIVLHLMYSKPTHLSVVYLFSFLILTEHFVVIFQTFCISFHM